MKGIRGGPGISENGFTPENCLCLHIPRIPTFIDTRRVAKVNFLIILVRLNQLFFVQSQS